MLEKYFKLFLPTNIFNDNTNTSFFEYFDNDENSDSKIDKPKLMRGYRRNYALFD